MHLVPAPAVRLMKRRVQSRPGARQENRFVRKNPESIRLLSRLSLVWSGGPLSPNPLCLSSSKCPPLKDRIGRYLEEETRVGPVGPSSTKKPFYFSFD